MTTGRINQVSTNKQPNTPTGGEKRGPLVVRELATELTGQRDPPLRRTCPEPLGPTRNRELKPALGKRSPRAIQLVPAARGPKPTQRCIREDAGFTLDNDTSSQECNRPPKELGGDYKSKAPIAARPGPGLSNQYLPQHAELSSIKGACLREHARTANGFPADEQMPADRLHHESARRTRHEV